MSKTDDFCTKNEEFCIKTEECCIENDEFCRFPTVLGRSTCLHPLYQRPFTVRERARACALPDWVELRGNLSQQSTQVGNLVPPPVAEAFGRELMIAAGLREDDWSARAAAGFASQSYWGTSAYSDRAVANGDAERRLHYGAESGETCHSIGKRLGFTDGFGLVDLNRPIYGDTLGVHARIKHTSMMKVTLLIPTASFARKATAAALARHEVYQEATDNQTPLEIAQRFGYDVEALIDLNSGDGGVFDSQTKPNSRLKKGTQVLLPGEPTVEAQAVDDQVVGPLQAQPGTNAGEGASGTDDESGSSPKSAHNQTSSAARCKICKHGSGWCRKQGVQGHLLSSVGLPAGGAVAGEEATGTNESPVAQRAAAAAIPQHEAAAAPGVTCEHCGRTFKLVAHLGNHRKSCRSDRRGVAAATEDSAGAACTADSGRMKRRRVMPTRLGAASSAGCSAVLALPQPGSPALSPPAVPAVGTALADLGLIGKAVRLRVPGHGEHDGRVTRREVHVAPTNSGVHRLEVLFEDGDVRWYTAAQVRRALK